MNTRFYDVIVESVDGIQSPLGLGGRAIDLGLCVSTVLCGYCREPYSDGHSCTAHAAHCLVHGVGCFKLIVKYERKKHETQRL